MMRLIKDTVQRCSELNFVPTKSITNSLLQRNHSVQKLELTWIEHLTGDYKGLFFFFFLILLLLL